MNESALLRRFRRMFQCDTARISKPCGRLFLIIGWNRNTKDKNYPGQWYKDGEPYDFDYLEEKVIASGDTEDELLASAKEYQRLLGMTMEEYLAERIEEARTSDA